MLGHFFGTLLNEGIPLFATRAFTQPFRGFVTAILTEKGAFCFRHGNFCFLTKVFKKACRLLAFKDLISNITEKKFIFLKIFYSVVCHNIKKYNFA
jgi:hypothetical protein